MHRSEIWLHSGIIGVCGVCLERAKKVSEAQWSPQSLNFDNTSGSFCVALARSPGSCWVFGGLYSIEISSSSYHNLLDFQDLQASFVVFCWKLSRNSDVSFIHRVTLVSVVKLFSELVAQGVFASA